MRKVTSLVLGLLAAGCGSGLGAVGSHSPWSVRWRPLARQSVEADTLFLLDVDRERSLRPGGQGGLIAEAINPDPWGSAVIAVRGRYREGMTNVGAPHPGYAWMPAEGVLAPDQFTIEFWLKSSVSWSELPLEVPLSVSDATGSANFSLKVGGGVVTAALAQEQRDPSTDVEATSDVLAGEPAGRWVELAATLEKQTLSLYVNGVRVAVAGGAVGPLEWSDAAIGDGLSLLGADGRPTVDLTLSDLRISRWARSPGQRVSLAPPTLTVDASRPTGEDVRQSLLGVLHTVGSGKDRRLVAPSVRVVRTDKLLTATPIKVGAPDATHPSAGVSGRFSYDWRVVDRTMRYIVSLPATPYLSIDATPSLLGGSVLPFSGAELRGDALAMNSAFPSQPPDDLGAYAAMVEDLVHHIVAQDHIRVAAWGVWNEPNDPMFWSGSFAQYVRLYAVAARAVKKADSSALVGGPETVTEPQWIPAFVRAVAQQHLPLDFISFHYYTGSVGTLDATRAMVDELASQDGIRSPPLIVGEWNWDLEDAPNAGIEPFRGLDYFANDWGAAFDASSMIAMQRDRVIEGVMASSTLEANPSLWTLATPTVIHAPLNVYRMWAMLGRRVVATSGPLPAGTSMIATRDNRGNVEIMIAHMRYRQDRSEPVIVHVKGVSATAHVTRYEIDRFHSDSIDAGAAHASLEQVPAPPLDEGELTLTLPARSVTLLTIDH